MAYSVSSDSEEVAKLKAFAGVYELVKDEQMKSVTVDVGLPRYLLKNMECSITTTETIKVRNDGSFTLTPAIPGSNTICAFTLNRWYDVDDFWGTTAQLLFKINSDSSLSETLNITIGAIEHKFEIVREITISGLRKTIKSAYGTQAKRYYLRK